MDFVGVDGPLRIEGDGGAVGRRDVRRLLSVGIAGAAAVSRRVPSDKSVALSGEAVGAECLPGVAVGEVLIVHLTAAAVGLIVDAVVVRRPCGIETDGLACGSVAASDIHGQHGRCGVGMQGVGIGHGAEVVAGACGRYNIEGVGRHVVRCGVGVREALHLVEADGIGTRRIGIGDGELHKIMRAGETGGKSAAVAGGILQVHIYIEVNRHDATGERRCAGGNRLGVKIGHLDVRDVVVTAGHNETGVIVSFEYYAGEVVIHSGCQLRLVHLELQVYIVVELHGKTRGMLVVIHRRRLRPGFVAEAGAGAREGVCHDVAAWTLLVEGVRHGSLRCPCRRCAQDDDERQEKLFHRSF